MTTFSLAREMDAGPIYLQHRTRIGPDEQADELRQRLAREGALAVLETLGLLARGTQPTPQDAALATHAPKLAKADGDLDFTATAEVIARIVRGTRPWPGAHGRFIRRDGKTADVQIVRARAVDEARRSRTPCACGESACPPGCVDEDRLVRCGERRLEIQQIKPAGKREMAWKDFVNGYRVVPGDRLRRATGTSETIMSMTARELAAEALRDRSGNIFRAAGPAADRTPALAGRPGAGPRDRPRRRASPRIAERDPAVVPRPSSQAHRRPDPPGAAGGALPGPLL